MTYDETLHVAPWISLDELLAKEPGDRVRYVRMNLRPDPGSRRLQPYMNHDDFALAVGVSSRSVVIRWEKGHSLPSAANAEAIAVLSPYPADVFRPLASASELRETRDRVSELESRVAALELARHS